jgi:hypothetical protein
VSTAEHLCRLVEAIREMRACAKRTEDKACHVMSTDAHFSTLFARADAALKHLENLPS